MDLSIGGLGITVNLYPSVIFDMRVECILLNAVWVSTQEMPPMGRTGSRARTNRSHYLRTDWEQGSDLNIDVTFGRLGARLGPDRRYYQSVGWERGSDHIQLLPASLGSMARTRCT